MTAIISSVPALNAIEKGVGATFTLDKSQLALVASVVASPYYSIQANWKNVILNYKSSTLSQTTSIGFDASLISPTGVFNVAVQATDIFQIQTISIVDFQNGYFVIPRSQLNVVDFDVDMSPVVSGVLFSPTLRNPTGAVTDGGRSVSVVSVGGTNVQNNYMVDFIPANTSDKYYMELTCTNRVGPYGLSTMGANFLNADPTVFVNDLGTPYLDIGCQASGYYLDMGFTIMIAIDGLNKKIWFGRDGVWDGNPVTNTGGHDYSAFALANTRMYLVAQLIVSSDVTKPLVYTYSPVGYTNI
jgi:hypothetical protein